jgi:molecular chaperone DnaK (HSP70)
LPTAAPKSCSRLADALLARLAAGAPRAPPPPRAWALRAAESAKVALSRAAVADVEAPDGRRLAVTEAELAAAAAPLLARLGPPLAALAAAFHVEWAAPPPAAAAAAARGEPADPARPPPRPLPPPPPPAWAPPPRRVTRVALVGQLTRLPLVRRYVAALTGLPAGGGGVDPGEAVALGAAAHAAALLGAGGAAGVELVDGAYAAEAHGRASGFGEWLP